MALRMGRLTRWTDRVEDVAAWVLLAAGLLLVLLACTLGIGVHAQMVRQGQTEALDRTATSATLLERAPLIASALQRRGSGRCASYLGRPLGDGPHGAGGGAAGIVAKGSTLTIWIDRSGASVPEPKTSGDALVLAGIVAGLVFSGGVVALAVLWAVLRHVLMAYNCAAWEQEWKAVAPLWSRDGGKRG